MVTAQKGARWVQVKIEPWNEYTSYVLTSVLVKGMAQEMEATADQMAAEIARTGRVAVYRDQLRHREREDQARVRQGPGGDREPARQEPGVDDARRGPHRRRGGKAANQSSPNSAPRRGGLADGHGIAPARLTPQGFGDGKPVADNKTEEGRARNRRVELVKL